MYTFLMDQEGFSPLLIKRKNYNFNKMADAFSFKFAFHIVLSDYTYLCVAWGNAIANFRANN